MSAKYVVETRFLSASVFTLSLLAGFGGIALGIVLLTLQEVQAAVPSIIGGVVLGVVFMAISRILSIVADLEPQVAETLQKLEHRSRRHTDSSQFRAGKSHAEQHRSSAHEINKHRDDSGIELLCPNCGYKHHASATVSGKHVICARCEYHFVAD